jgi:phosphatidylglycerophosphate synthase
MEPHVRCAIILPPTDASFRTIAGLPLIQRTALSALRGGFERVVAMAGRDGERLRAVLARDARTRAIPVVDGPVAPIVDAEHVALLPSDALVTAATLRRVATTESDGSALAFRADGAATDDPGVLLVARERLAALDDSADGPAAVGRLLGARAVSLNGELCIPAPDARAAARAEDALVAQVAASSAATDGPIARMDRAVSTRLSRLLVTTPIRPNHVTLIGTAIGFLSAWMFAQGTYWSGVLGSLLFWFAVIIDGCDGEVAKLTFQESRFGHWLDIVTDNIVHVAIFVGLAVGQYRAAPDGNYETLIVILLIGFSASSAIRRSGCSAPEPAAGSSDSGSSAASSCS